MNMRPLTREEKTLIANFANRLQEGERRQLLADLEQATAAPMTRDAAIIMFEIAGYQRPPYRGQHPFGVEGKMFDKDGADLTVLLHADKNGRLLELEFIRWGEGDLLGQKWETLTLY
jgi:acetyl-CoA acetyltransferase